MSVMLGEVLTFQWVSLKKINMQRIFTISNQYHPKDFNRFNVSSLPNIAITASMLGDCALPVSITLNGMATFGNFKALLATASAMAACIDSLVHAISASCVANALRTGNTSAVRCLSFCLLYTSQVRCWPFYLDRFYDLLNLIAPGSHIV